MKIIFFATSEFAIPILQKLKEGGFDIVAVVTQPDKPAGRKQEPLPSPVKKWALAHGINNVLQPEKLSIKYLVSSIKGVELFIVASYGKIIPKEVLDYPRFGALNIHPSLLPKYRGPSPIQETILNGDEETGVTIIEMDEKMDHGSIIQNAKFKMQNSKLTFQELHDRLAELGAELLFQILPKYLRGEIKPTPQNENKATYTKIITKADARIDWRNCAEEIDRKIRAYSSWPVAWTTLDGKRVKIFEADVQEQKILEGRPGQILEAEKNLAIRCGEESHCKLNILLLKIFQREGGKKLDVATFLRGQRNLKGKILV